MKIVILVLLSLVLVGAHVIDNKKVDKTRDDNGEWWRSGVVRFKYFMHMWIHLEFKEM